jgi:non-heme chloroperoxidase
MLRILNCRRQQRFALIAIAMFATLPLEVARTQALTCTGLEFFRSDSSGHMVALDLARSDRGVWSLTHARIDHDGGNHAKSVSVDGNAISVVLDDLPAEFHGTLSPNATAVVGEWSSGGRRVPMRIQCTHDASAQPHTAAHRTQFIAVEPQVRLEVLDWGGTGQPLIFIHGMNQTAHDFDAFIPRLGGDYHVYAITRRGAGQSSAPDTGYSADRLGDDVLTVMDSLQIARAVLIGHSYGGAELSSVGSRHPERVNGLIYLDAAMGYAFLDPSVPDPFGGAGPNGLRCPCSYLEKLNKGMHAYRHLDVPALAIYAMGPDFNEKDALGRSNAMQADSFERNVRGARVVRIPNATHYVFRSNEAEVLGAMRSFLATLP